MREFEKKLSHQSVAVRAMYAPPYAPQAAHELAGAAETLRKGKVDVIAMACPGYTSEMEAIIRRITGKLVVLARSIMDYLAKELGG